MAVIQFKVKVEGLDELLRPMLTEFVGTDRIKRLRVAYSKAANRMKYYMKSAFAKHRRSGLLYKSISYRVKYYRARDTLVLIVGVKSKQELVYKGRKQVSHMYAKFLIKGRGQAKQLLRQPPFHPRTTDPAAKPKYPRTSGPQPAYINLQAIVNANLGSIHQAAVFGVRSFE
jgi:hypothetical protein